MRDPRVPRRARLLIAVLALSWLAIASPSPAAAQDEPAPTATPSPGAATLDATDEPRDQIVLSGTVTVRRGDEAGQIVVFHGFVDVAGVAMGDVIVVDGRILITGQVSGTVVNVDGTVALGPNAHVLGDVMAGENVRVAEGAIVEGDVREGASFVLRGPIEALGGFASWLAVALSTLLLAALLLALAPQGAEAVAVTAVSAPWASLGLGLAVAIALPVFAVATSATLVGLPFGLALLLALWFVASIGFALSVFAVGRLLWRAPRSRWLALLFGWAAVTAVSAIPWVGGILWSVGAVVGLGAATVAVRRAHDEPPPAANASSGRHRAGSRTPERVAAPLTSERTFEQGGTGT